MNSKIRLIGFLISSLLIAAMISRDGDLAWMMLPFLAYLVVGVLRSPQSDRLMFTVVRSVERSQFDGKTSLDVTVSIQNESLQSVQVRIDDSIPPESHLLDGKGKRLALLQPDETTEIDYTLSIKRGDYSWKSIHVMVCDPLGLIQVEQLLPAPAAVQIRPDIRKFKAIALRPRSTLHSPGSIPARLGGSGTDFYGIREYQPGDPLRSLDWRMTARHPFKFFTKEFEQEEIADIGLILDGRQNCEVRIGDESLFEHGVNATASLAEMFLHQGHRLSLMVIGRRLNIAFPGYGKIQLNRVLGCLARARIETEERVSTHLDFLPVRIFPSHSLIIVISPLASGDLSFYQRLRANGYQVLLISPDTIDFAHSKLSTDIDNRLAVRAVQIERRLLLDSIRQLSIPIINWQIDQPLFPLVRNALTRSRGQGE